MHKIILTQMEILWC